MVYRRDGWEGDFPEFFPGTGPLDAGRLVKAGGHRLQAAEKQQGLHAALPQQIENAAHQAGDGVHKLLPQPDAGEELADRRQLNKPLGASPAHQAGRGGIVFQDKDYHPGGDDNRQEQNCPRHRAPMEFLVKQQREKQPEHQDHEGFGQHGFQASDQLLDKGRILGEQRQIILPSQKGHIDPARRQLQLAQRIIQRADKRDDEEGNHADYPGQYKHPAGKGPALFQRPFPPHSPFPPFPPRGGLLQNGGLVFIVDEEPRPSLEGGDDLAVFLPPSGDCPSPYRGRGLLVVLQQRGQIRGPLGVLGIV